MKNYVIGIDLGGTKISGALADIDGKVLSMNTLKTNASEGSNAVLNRIFKIISQVILDSNIGLDEIKAIGIGSPGPLDVKEGIILVTPNLPFKNFRLVEKIENKFGVKTYLDNDANVAAIGEYMLGAGVGKQNIVYITVSTGVGGGAIINGKIYRGNTYNALEIGHMTILPDGPLCNCGNYGCLEALASGTAIAKRANEAVKSRPSSLSKYDTISSLEVFEEAEKGDKVSKEILDKCLTYLGIGVSNIITNFDPELVIIGGGVSKGGQIVFDKVKEVVKERCFDTMAERCMVVPAGLGTDAGVIGAVALAIMESK